MSEEWVQKTNSVASDCHAKPTWTNYDISRPRFCTLHTCIDRKQYTSAAIFYDKEDAFTERLNHLHVGPFDPILSQKKVVTVEKKIGWTYCTPKSLAHDFPPESKVPANRLRLLGNLGSSLQSSRLASWPRGPWQWVCCTLILAVPFAQFAKISTRKWATDPRTFVHKVPWIDQQQVQNDKNVSENAAWSWVDMLLHIMNDWHRS